MSLRDFPTAKKRRQFLEKELDLELQNIESLEIEENENVHCENLIGASKIPLGVAGPLLVLSGAKKEKVYYPLATTEGALVASINRGCKAISESGGASVDFINHGQTRGPVFSTGNITKGIELKSWIEKNGKSIQKEAAKTSTHIKYLGAKVKIIGSLAFVRFSFSTGNAMGMNMVTLATEKISVLIEKELNIKLISVAGNFDNDKKASFLNSIEGRGFEVFAECILKGKVLDKILHTNAEKIFNVWLSKNMVGSYAAGSISYNSHFANIIAAIFIATGQDAAHVVEGSSGIFYCEVRKNDLYISVNLPSVLVGTIGGGTTLPTQQKCLEIMGIEKTSPSSSLATKIAGAVLAGELSLLSSLSIGSLGVSHKKLGR